MKKKWIQRGVSLGLTAAMMLGLTACGGGGGKVSSDPNLAKQYVYSCQDIEISNMGENFDIRSGSYRNGTIYLLVNVYNYSDTSNEQVVKLLTLDEDGSNVQTVDLQMPSQEDNKGQDDQGEAQKDPVEAGAESSDEPSEEGSGEDIDISARPFGSSSTYEYTGYSNYGFTEDGRLYALKNHNMEDYSDPENYVSKQQYFLCYWDLEGNLLGEFPLETVNPQEEYYYITAVVPLSNGDTGILYSGDSVQMSTVDSQGNVSERKPMSDNASILQNGANVIVQEDGTLLVIYYDENDWSKMYVATYDLNTDTVSEGVMLPNSIAMSGYNYMGAGAVTDLIYTDNNGVYTYNMGDEQSQMMMSFINSDLNISGMNNVIVIDDSRFVGLYYDSINYESNVSIFTKVNPEDIPDKQVLVLAGNYVDSDIKQRVVDFNKNNNEYRIVIKEYSSYATSEDYTAGYTQLNNDIISGSMPDIIVVDNSSNLPIENYISKGLIADVKDLIEKDEELSQVEFMENVFEAFSVDGKLYQVIPSFNVMTIIGKKSIVGDRTSWTMKDLEELIASLPEGTVAIGELTQMGFFNMMMQYCGSEFVDVSSGKCNFDSQNFIDMLEFAKDLPQELSEDYYDDDFWENYDSQYRENRTVLMNCYISSVSDMNRTINGAFGEEVSFIGFPTESGNGSSINSGGNFVLSARSKNLDGAWQFVRYYLTEEYQKDLHWGLPISKAVFMEKAKEAANKPYYIDENGKKVEYTETYYINDENIELDPMSQEQIDQVVNFIQSVNTRSYYNQDIYKILEEEVAAYFSGQKSAQEVAKVIQSRAQIYVSENR